MAAHSNVTSRIAASAIFLEHEEAAFETKSRLAATKLSNGLLLLDSSKLECRASFRANLACWFVVSLILLMFWVDSHNSVEIFDRDGHIRLHSTS